MIVDLCAGPGGWSTALKALGEDSMGLDTSADARATARAAGHRRMALDVRGYDPTVFENVTGLTGSPPCQGFSLAGLGKGRQDAEQLLAAVTHFVDGDPRLALRSQMMDRRSLIALEPLRWVLRLLPEWTAWEQVPTVLPLWEACAHLLRAHGYSVWTGLLRAEQYGVPQTRTRAVLTASRTLEAAMPPATHSKYHSQNPTRLDPGVLPWVSMAEALGDPEPRWFSPTNLRPNTTLRHTGEPAPTLAFGHERPQWLPTEVVGFPRLDDTLGDSIELDGQRYRARDLRPASHPAHTITEKTRSWRRWEPTAANPGTTEEDMEWVHSRPSPTIVGSFRPDIVAAPGRRLPGDGPRQTTKGSVRVTVQEASVLQSFPRDYPWSGSMTSRFQQVGDAVPPLLALHVLRSLGVGSGTQM